jgi:hypothetical protein
MAYLVQADTAYWQFMLRQGRAPASVFDAIDNKAEASGKPKGTKRKMKADNINTGFCARGRSSSNRDRGAKTRALPRISSMAKASYNQDDSDDDDYQAEQQSRKKH